MGFQQTFLVTGSIDLQNVGWNYSAVLPRIPTGQAPPVLNIMQLYRIFTVQITYQRSYFGFEQNLNHGILIFFSNELIKVEELMKSKDLVPF